MQGVADLQACIKKPRKAAGLRLRLRSTGSCRDYGLLSRLTIRRTGLPLLRSALPMA
jgi:hypothetical protein